MKLQKILNLLMGVHFEEEPKPEINLEISPQPKTIEELLEEEDTYPATCERTDCLVYGVYKECYVGGGCNHYRRDHSK